MMDKKEKYKDVPHFDLITENSPVVIPSIFMFTTHTELYSFLHACEAFKCSVFFENEKLIVPPNKDIDTELKLIGYSTVASCREIGEAYVRYLNNADNMNWVQGVHEPILND